MTSSKIEITDIANSDDELEFHDAEAKATIEEITTKQANLHLDNNTEPSKDKESWDRDKESQNKVDEFVDCNQDEENSEAEDFIDEEGLAELEKEMTEEDKINNLEEAKNLKEKANALFKNGENEAAAEFYTKALKLCPTTYPKDRAILYSNRAAAKINLDSKNAAIDDCTQALKLHPEYVRALLRRAKLYEATDKLDESLEDYKRISELDPGNIEASSALVRLPPQINERNEKLKEEMLGKLKNLGDMILKPFGLSTNNFELQKDPTSGGYSVNFNQSNKK